MADSIFLIRHAEKPDREAGTAGVALDGRPDAQSLSVRGWQRAAALALLFDRLLTHPRYALLRRPTQLFAAVDTEHSRRPRDTLRPLSEQLGLPIRELDSDGDPRAAAAALSTCEGHVLVCWRHGELPALARALLPQAADAVPARWHEARFDLIWIVGANDLTVVPQRLLAGDVEHGDEAGHPRCLLGTA